MQNLMDREVTIKLRLNFHFVNTLVHALQAQGQVEHRLDEVTTNEQVLRLIAP